MRLPQTSFELTLFVQVGVGQISSNISPNVFCAKTGLICESQTCLHGYSTANMPRHHQLWCQMHAFSVLKDCFRLCPKLCLCLRYVAISITLEHNLSPGQIMFVCAGELAVRANAVACDGLSTSPNTNNGFVTHVATCSNLQQHIAALYGSNEIEHPDQEIQNILKRILFMPRRRTSELCPVYVRRTLPQKFQSFKV